MSLLLDAIKQSGQHEQTAVDHDQAALALKQQQELTRYRRLAFSFGLLLAAILTLMAGFSIGKWLQQNKPFAEQPKVVNNSNEATENATTEAQVSPESQQPAKQDQVAQPHTQPSSSNHNVATRAVDATSHGAATNDAAGASARTAIPVGASSGKFSTCVRESRLSSTAAISAASCVSKSACISIAATIFSTNANAAD